MEGLIVAGAGLTMLLFWIFACAVSLVPFYLLYLLLKPLVAKWGR